MYTNKYAQSSTIMNLCPHTCKLAHTHAYTHTHTYIHAHTLICTEIQC